MKFFVPDWDDRVDPGYDFLTDRFSLVRDPYESDVYAHELFKEKSYDGILVSRMALDKSGKSGKKRELMYQKGIRAYLRMPPELELFGDCGAFGYVTSKDPEFETAEIVDYYDQLGFDYGVSVDHLVVPEFDSERDYRYDLTLRNADEFLRLYSRGRHRFTPIGAIQGWDTDSYVEAARSVVAMGYEYIAIGGLARSDTRTIAATVVAISEALPSNIQIHVFGVARLTLLPLFLERNLASVDSASPLRQAWLSARENYYTVAGTYAAIRIPIAHEERPKGQTLVGRSTASLAELKGAEMEALEAVRNYDQGKRRLKPTLDAVIAYDKLLANRLDASNSERRWQLYHRTLKDEPWKRCSCDVCRDLGVEVIIFRGNNRNRRRGFHNIWVVRQRINLLARTTIAVSRSP